MEKNTQIKFLRQKLQVKTASMKDLIAIQVASLSPANVFVSKSFFRLISH
jgi:hypothetical protein